MSEGKAMSRQPRCGNAGYSNSRGEPCGAVPIAGLDACRRHVGKPLAQAKAEGAIRREVIRWNLDRAHLDPVETYLRLATVTADRAQWLAELLAEAYEAAERIADAGQAAEPPAAGEDAARDLDEILTRGGLAALVGKTWAADKQAGIYATGEALRGLAKLEQDERRLAADMAFKAIAAGLGERIARIPEQVAEQLAEVVRGIVAGLGFDTTDPRVRRYIADHLKAAAGGPPAGRLLEAEQQETLRADVRRVNESPAAGWRPT